MGLHLFPFRTEKLNPSAPMVLRKRESRSPPSSKLLSVFIDGKEFFICSIPAVPDPVRPLGLHSRQ